MSENKMSAMEHAAIMRKRNQFFREIYDAVQPIFERYTGQHNAGTYAIKVAEDALSQHKASIDYLAVTELVASVDYLREIMQERKQ